MDFHELANLFPLLEYGTPAFIELANDIEASGLRNPIITYEDKILDGRNRFRACEARGVEPRFEEWQPRSAGDTPLAYVISINLHRRHLTDSQRQLIAAKLVTRKRGSAGGKGGMSQQQAADLLNVKKGMVLHARRVLRDAPPEEIAKVERGEKKMSQVLYDITDRGHKRKADREPAPFEPAREKTKRCRSRYCGEVIPADGPSLCTKCALADGNVEAAIAAEDAGRDHVVGVIRAAIDSISSRRREVVTITKEVRVQLCWDFARALQVTPAAQETCSDMASSLGAAGDSHGQ